MEFAQPRLIPLTLHSAGLRAFGRRSAAIRSRVVAQHGLWKLTVQLNAQPQKLASFISELRNDARASPSFRLFAFPLNGAGRNSPIESIPTKCIGINRDRSGSTANAHSCLKTARFALRTSRASLCETAPSDNRNSIWKRRQS